MKSERVIYHAPRRDSEHVKYNPDLGDELRHKLWRLKERTGVPMTVHLREALSLYLDAYEKAETERMDELELEMWRSEFALERLRQVLGKERPD